MVLKQRIVFPSVFAVVPNSTFWSVQIWKFFLLMTWSSVIPLKNHKAMGTFSIFKCSNAQTKASPFLELSGQHVFSWRDALCAHACLGLKYLLSDSHVIRESLYILDTCFLSVLSSVGLLSVLSPDHFWISVEWKILFTLISLQIIENLLLRLKVLVFFLTKLTTFGCLALWCHSLPSLTIRAVSSLLCYLCNLILNFFFLIPSKMQLQLLTEFFNSTLFWRGHLGLRKYLPG